MEKYKTKFFEENEVPEGFDAFIKKVAKMTDRNSHNEARMEIAKFFKDSFYEKIFKEIIALHTLEGSMDYNLIKYRDQKTEEMFYQIGQKYGEDIVGKINSGL